MQLTFFRDGAAREKFETNESLDQLRDRILNKSAAKKSDLPWVKLALFGDKPSDKGCLRHDDNVIAVCGVELDFDGGTHSFEWAVGKAEAAKLNCVICTTPSHTPSKPRWRVYAPTSQPLAPVERKRLAARANAVFDNVCAPESYKLSQAFYYGHINDDPHYATVVPGDFIDDRPDLDAAPPPEQPAPQVESSEAQITQEQLAALYSDPAFTAARHIPSGDAFRGWICAVSDVTAHAQWAVKLTADWMARDTKWPNGSEDTYDWWSRLKDQRPGGITGGTFFKIVADAGLLDLVKSNTRTPTVPIDFTIAHDAIKPTPWAVQNYAVREAVTVNVSIGGVGKTQWSIQSAVAWALGETFMGFKPMRPLRITFVCGEETVEEMQRRLAAVVLHMVNGDTNEFARIMAVLQGKFFIFGVKDVAIVRKVIEGGKESIERTQFFTELAMHAKQSTTDLLIADPASRLHDGLIENSHEMQHLHNALDAIAMHANCAVVMVHHANKASQGTVDNQQASRGHSSVTDAARIVVVMAPMSVKEAEALLSDDERANYLSYVKIGNPKQNYGPNDTQRWLHKVSVKLPVNLEDGTPDSRMAFETFTPDANVDVLKADWFSKFLDNIEHGKDGEFYSTATKGDGLRADTLLVEYGVPKGKAKATLDMLVSLGVLAIEMRPSKTTRGRLRSVYVLLSRSPSMEGLPF